MTEVERIEKKLKVNGCVTSFDVYVLLSIIQRYEKSLKDLIENYKDIKKELDDINKDIQGLS